MTLAPLFEIVASKCSSCLSRDSIARHFRFLAFSRIRCSSVNCCLPWGTTALYLPILKFIFRRCSLSAALIVLLAKKFKDASLILHVAFLVYYAWWLLLLALYKNLFQTFFPMALSKIHKPVLLIFYPVHRPDCKVSLWLHS